MLQNQERLEQQMREKYSVEKLFDNASATVVKEEADLEEKEDFSKLKDFGPKMNEAILSYNYEKVYSYKKYLRIQDKKEEKQFKR